MGRRKRKGPKRGIVGRDEGKKGLGRRMSIRYGLGKNLLSAKQLSKNKVVAETTLFLPHHPFSAQVDCITNLHGVKDNDSSELRKSIYRGAGLISMQKSACQCLSQSSPHNPQPSHQPQIQRVKTSC